MASEHQITELLAAQDGIVAMAQLRALGLNRQAVHVLVPAARGPISTGFVVIRRTARPDAGPHAAVRPRPRLGGRRPRAEGPRWRGCREVSAVFGAGTGPVYPTRTRVIWGERAPDRLGGAAPWSP